MIKKFKILLLFSFFIEAGTFGQNCPKGFSRGELIIENESKKKVLCYDRSPVFDVVDNIFITKYIFRTEGGKGNYKLEFSFLKDLDSISITYTNVNEPYEEQKGIKFDPSGSIYVFKDYLPNDTSINKNDDYRILFTVTEESRPYITLNQFQLLDNEAVLFKLQEIDDMKLKLHNLTARPYHSKKKSAPIMIIDPVNKRTAAELIGEMEQYRDSEVKRVGDIEERLMAIVGSMNADYDLAAVFNNRIDSICKEYYKNTFPYEDHNSKIEVEFNCNSKGNVDAINKIYSVNSPEIKWFEDSFRVSVLPRVKTLTLGTMTVPQDNETIVNDFDARFLDKEKDPGFSSGEMLKVHDKKKEIRPALENLRSRKLNVPTIYIYTISYQSIVKHETWEHKTTKKGIEICGPVNSDEIIQTELKNKFKTNVMQKRKGTKYNVKRCDVYMNGKLIGQDLQPE